MNGISSGISLKKNAGVSPQLSDSSMSLGRIASTTALVALLMGFPRATTGVEDLPFIPQILNSENPPLVVPRRTEKLTMSTEEFGKKYPELFAFLGGLDENVDFNNIIEKTFNTLDNSIGFFNDPKKDLEYEGKYREYKGYVVSQTLSGTIQNFGFIIQTLKDVKKTLLQGVGDHVNFNHSQEDCFSAINKAIQEYNRIYEKKESLLNQGQYNLLEERRHDGYNMDDVAEWINSGEKAPVQPSNYIRPLYHPAPTSHKYTIIG